MVTSLKEDQNSSSNTRIFHWSPTFVKTSILHQTPTCFGKHQMLTFSIKDQNSPPTLSTKHKHSSSKHTLKLHTSSNKHKHFQTPKSFNKDQNSSLNNKNFPEHSSFHTSIPRHLQHPLTTSCSYSNVLQQRPGFFIKHQYSSLNPNIIEQHYQ